MTYPSGREEYVSLCLQSNVGRAFGQRPFSRITGPTETATFRRHGFAAGILAKVFAAFWRGTDYWTWYRADTRTFRAGLGAWSGSPGRDVVVSFADISGSWFGYLDRIVGRRAKFPNLAV